MQWLLTEEVREPARHGIIPIQPFQNTSGYIVNANPIHLQPDEQYWLNVGVSDIRNDSLIWSDVGVKIKIGFDPTCNDTLYDQIVNFTDGWIDLSFPINVTRYAGKDVYVRAESYNGGLVNWSSEWAAVDYLFINNSKGEIVNPDPFFDNGWKNVVEELRKRGFDPYFIMDFSGYQSRIQDFADYFLEFADSIHCYNPVTDISKNLSVVFHIYNQASEAAHSQNKTFVATVMPGYNDSQNVVNRQNGTYYALFWSIAKACSADGYTITSFNEWHEGTEIEPSIEYGYKYIDLTRVLQDMWTSLFNIEVISNSTLCDFHVDVAKKMVSFNISGLKDTEGFCNITIPNLIVQDLWEGNYTVLLNGNSWPFTNWTDTTNTYIHINYTHTEHQITLIPEIPSFLLPQLFTATTLLTIMVKKKITKGKFRLDASTLLLPCEKEIDAKVYIHLKGYARARVSHIDIEKIGLGKVIHRGRGNFLEIKGIENGLEIVLRERRQIILDGEEVAVSSLVLICPLLNEIVEKEKLTRAWVGRKYDGIYIGFRKAELEKLEKLALEKFGVKPLKKLEKPPLKIKSLRNRVVGREHPNSYEQLRRAPRLSRRKLQK